MATAMEVKVITDTGERSLLLKKTILMLYMEEALKESL